jgi:hypothetical protein
VKLEDIKMLEETKQEVIKILESENVKGFIFAAEIDDTEIKNETTFSRHFFAQSTKEGIGYCELLKHYLIKQLTRKDQ